MPAHSSGHQPTVSPRAERRAAARGRAVTPAHAGKVQDPGRKAAAPRQWSNRRRG